MRAVRRRYGQILVTEPLDAGSDTEPGGSGLAAERARRLAELDAMPRGRPVPPPASVAAYSRREIAGRFAEILDRITEGRRPSKTPHGVVSPG